MDQSLSDKIDGQTPRILQEREDIGGVNNLEENIQSILGELLDVARPSSEALLKYLKSAGCYKKTKALS